jgi:hypothetical protein
MHVSSSVHARDEMGRFIADIEGAATELVTDAIGAGVAAARTAAPIRSGRLRRSFVPEVVSRTMARFFNTAPYAEFQDLGAGPHPLPARVSFFWARAGRMWMWPETYLRRTGHPGADPIQHPGNPATHFMDAGYQAAVAEARRALPRYYP